jgi:hypothetical protein
LQKLWTCQFSDDHKLRTYKMKTNRLLFCGVISKFCCATLAIFAAMAQSFAATVTLPPAADTCVRADHPATNYLSEPDLAIRNRGKLEGKNYDANVLMRFDLSRIPSGSSITKATLVVWETASYTLDQRIGAYRVTEAWDPAQVTYEQRTADVPWKTPGGDFAGRNGFQASFPYGAVVRKGPWVTGTRQDYDVTAMVREWVDRTHPNHGLLLHADQFTDGHNGDWGIIGSNEKLSHEPRLNIDYETANSPVASAPTPRLAGEPLKVAVKPTPTGPVLQINGQPQAPMLFHVGQAYGQSVNPANAEIHLAEFEMAGRHGIQLLSLSIAPNFPKEGEAFDFTSTDLWIDNILRVHPDALFMPRIGIWGPSWLRGAYPDEIDQFHDGSKGEQMSVFSPGWRAQAERNLVALVRHLEEKYGDRMFGYQPTMGHAGEWYYNEAWFDKISGYEKPSVEAFRAYLKNAYGTVEALRAAWRDPAVTFENAPVPANHKIRTRTAGTFRDPATERQVIDFFEAQNAGMCDAAIGICKAIKSAAPDKIACIFYGYTMELGAQPLGIAPSGHLALGRLLKSPYVDAVAGPIGYFNRGLGGYFMGAVDSVQRAGKLWFNEDDSRTHVSGVKEGWGVTSTLSETRSLHTRNLAHVLTRGAGAWWTDIPGAGWLNDDETIKHLGVLKKIYESTLDHLEPYTPEIAVIVDEKSSLYLGPGLQVSHPLLHVFRKEFYHAGAPIGVYLLGDLLAGKVPPVRLYLMVNLFHLDPQPAQQLKALMRQDGRTAVWMYAPGYIREDSLSLQFVEDLTGLALAKSDRGDGHIVLENEGGAFDAGHPHLSPTIAVADPTATTLARYADGNQPAIASKKVADSLQVFCGTLQLPARLIRRIAREAGVHVYSDSDDLIMAGNSYVSLFATSAGQKTLRMPTSCSLVDAVSGEKLGPASVFEFEAGLRDTRLFRVVKQ